MCLVMERMDTSLDRLLYKDPNRPLPLSLVRVRVREGVGACRCTGAALPPGLGVCVSGTRRG